MSIGGNADLTQALEGRCEVNLPHRSRSPRGVAAFESTVELPVDHEDHLSEISISAFGDAEQFWFGPGCHLSWHKA